MANVKVKRATPSEILEAQKSFTSTIKIWHQQEKSRNSYCNECDFIYNPLPCIIYTIPEEDEPISSCVSELKIIFNSNSNSDNNNDKNNGFSSMQTDNNNYDDLNSNSNPEQYIALSNLFKKQELK
ncbi:hypothetical protein G9A89_008504 [Geosiphon pyriformis]|nr:hypothetical protein G9A89_008504 [Geosiphon pyriformis]